MPLADDHSELYGAEIVDRVLLIEVDQIDEGNRLRAVDTAWAEALGHMMARDGQKKSIDVCRLPSATRWTLVDGAHRLAGARSSGIVSLRAEVVSSNREERRLREILAQLAHRGLSSPLDRAAFIAELVQLKRAQAGLSEVAFRDGQVRQSLKRAVSDEANGTMETISMVYGWSDEVGEQLGFTGRTIRNDLMLYRGLAPSQVERLRIARHPILGNGAQLRSLAKLDHVEQDRVVAALTRGSNPPKNVAAAIAQIRGSNRPNDPEAKRLSAFLGTYARMGLAEKKGALRQLPLPAGTRLLDESTSQPDNKYRLEMIDAMSSAITLLDTLYEGSGGGDDDEIYATRTKLQLSLLAANAGAIPGGVQRLLSPMTRDGGAA